MEYEWLYVWGCASMIGWGCEGEWVVLCASVYGREVGCLIVCVWCWAVIMWVCRYCECASVYVCGCMCGVVRVWV